MWTSKLTLYDVYRNVFAFIDNSLAGKLSLQHIHLSKPPPPSATHTNFYLHNTTHSLFCFFSRLLAGFV